MIGGAGDDVYQDVSLLDVIDESPASNGSGVDLVTSSVSFSLAIASPFIENLFFSGTADLSGTGNGLANFIVGNAGANILDGLGGADAMRGFGGNDTYIVDSPGDIVDETGGNGIDTVQTAVSFSLADTVHAKDQIEDLVLLGSANLNGIGNTLANVITGNPGANLLDGQAGSDIMRGLDGDDAYVVDSLNDNVIETAGGGSDTILASLSYALASEVENLTLLGTGAIDATGNVLANVITGNDNANLIDGRDGADVMRGLGGNDTYVADNAGDMVDETAVGSDGIDTVLASTSFVLGEGVESLTLTGTAAINGTGNALANTIAGNGAANILTGGAGADSFLFGAKLNKKANVDTLADFSHADDTIILDNAIFTKLKKEGVLKGKLFHEGKKAHDGNDRIIYNENNGKLTFDKNGDHKGGAMKFAALPEDLDLNKGDFFVV